MARKRILFVDDEDRVLGALQNTLRRYRREWETVFAASGEEALERLSAGAFDVVVTDMRMPGMDGAMLLRRVQEQFPRIARIVLSGHADREAVVRTLPVAHQYLSKPCDVETLHEVIERTCSLQTLLQDEAIRTIVGAFDKLPSLPRCFVELTKAATGSPNSLEAVSRAVEQDPAMSAKVLQLVNSTYFGAGQQVTSVQRAVFYLGAELIQGLALSSHVFEEQTDALVCGGLSLDVLQEHSLMTARLARRFLSDARRADEAFAAGIVHDIGKLVLALGCPERYAAVSAMVRRDHVPAHEAERELLGTDHAAVGAYLLGVWGLPFSIVEAVAYHHAPSLMSSGSSEVLAAVHLADAMANACADPNSTRSLVDDAFMSGLDPVMVSDWYAIAGRDLGLLAKAS